jgi:RNA polymerase sigma-70 factor (ECF subfamily)
LNPREDEWSALMRAANAGDEVAYGRLLRALAPVLRGVARRGLRSAGRGEIEAEDIVQETLLAIHLKRQTWDSDSLFSPWLWTIARNKLIDTLRRSGRRAEVPIEDWSDILAAEEPRPDVASDLVTQQLETLPPRQRDVVSAVAIKGDSTREAAVRLDMTEGAVRVALHRGLSALASELRSKR